VVTKIVILGGAGDGAVVAEAIRDLAANGARISIHGFLDDAVPQGSAPLGAPVLGALHEWPRLDPDVVFIAALHKVKQMESRASLIARLGIPETRWTSVIHPTARVAGDVRVGAGSFLAAYAVVQPGSRIGRHVSIRAGANVGHDAVLEDFSYAGPNSTLAGRAVLEQGAHLGPNAAVLDQRRVGRYSVVGLCSAVTRDIPEREIWMGVPARRVRSLPPDDA
jgi:acetyltransferase EpsM